MFDLKIPENSYIFGFLQADGHMSKNTRNRGRIQIELARKDLLILENISKLIPVSSTLTHRERDTNFKKDYQSSILTIFDWEFRTQLETFGLPYGSKHTIISPPKTEFSKIDYIRGLIDGDGSLGFTGDHKPFISLNTSSDNISNFYKQFAKDITGYDCLQARNKRDNTYNICFFNENAQLLSGQIYYTDCLAIVRKMESAQKIKEWIRPSHVKKREPSKKWTSDQDQYILNHSVEESTKQLDRSEQSIKMRLWRLSAQ